MGVSEEQLYCNAQGGIPAETEVRQVVPAYHILFRAVRPQHMADA